MKTYDKEKTNDLITRIKCCVDLDQEIVAVKFLFTKEEFEIIDVNQPKGKMTYCKMVDRATKGESLKADFDNFGCFGGARALGIVDIDRYYESGRFFAPRGLFKDLTTARYAASKIEKINQETYGLLVQPLKDFEVDPDIVIFIVKSYQAMRIIQGYAYENGTIENLKIVGNQAMCAEVTAHPFNHNSINISLSCKGARTNSMEDDEVAIGMVFGKFEGMANGLCMSVTANERERKKDKVIENFKKNGIDDVEVVMQTSYGKPFYSRDYPYFDEKRKQNTREYEESFENIFNEKKRQED